LSIIEPFGPYCEKRRRPSLEKNEQPSPVRLFRLELGAIDMKDVEAEKKGKKGWGSTARKDGTGSAQGKMGSKQVTKCT